MAALFAGTIGFVTLAVAGPLTDDPLELITMVTLGITGYATLPLFPLFLVGSAIIGFGSGAIDAGLNTYAARHFGARHMNWLHAAYSVGAALGPVLTTTLLTLLVLPAISRLILARTKRPRAEQHDEAPLGAAVPAE